MLYKTEGYTTHVSKIQRVFDDYEQAKSFQNTLLDMGFISVIITVIDLTWDQYAESLKIAIAESYNTNNRMN